VVAVSLKKKQLDEARRVAASIARELRGDT